MANPAAYEKARADTIKVVEDLQLSPEDNERLVLSLHTLIVETTMFAVNQTVENLGVAQ